MKDEDEEYDEGEGDDGCEHDPAVQVIAAVVMGKPRSLPPVFLVF